jgi:anti-sigma B factor antagonist
MLLLGAASNRPQCPWDWDGRVLVDPMLDVEVVNSHGDGYAVVRVTGEVDMASAPLLRERLEHAARTCPRVIVDLSNVTFFGAAGLHCLERADELLARRGATLSVVTDEDSLVMRILRVTNLDDRWRVHPGPADAVRVAVLPGV